MNKRNFTPSEVEHIILMAWADTISYEAIHREWGLNENELVRFMRVHQSHNSYRRWRERVRRRAGAGSKHEAYSKVTSRRLKFAV